MKQILTLLRLQFFLWPLLALALLFLCETEILPAGQLAATEMSQSSFLMLTTVQLLTIGVIPVSLKLLHWTLIKKRIAGHTDAFRPYLFWSIVRCSLLGVVLLLNMGIYYSMFNTSGALGALIVLVAYVFCWPSEQKIKAETIGVSVDMK